MISEEGGIKIKKGGIKSKPKIFRSPGLETKELESNRNNIVVRELGTTVTERMHCESISIQFRTMPSKYQNMIFFTAIKEEKSKCENKSILEVYLARFKKSGKEKIYKR